MAGNGGIIGPVNTPIGNAPQRSTARVTTFTASVMYSHYNQALTTTVD